MVLVFGLTTVGVVGAVVLLVLEGSEVEAAEVPPPPQAVISKANAMLKKATHPTPGEKVFAFG